MSVSPTASRLIFAAAPTYRSISAGDVPRTSAILSRPSLESSAGRIVAEVDVDRDQVANRVRIFRAIQPVQRSHSGIRFRSRCLVDAFRASRESVSRRRDPAAARRLEASGRREACWMTFSQTSAFAVGMIDVELFQHEPAGSWPFRCDMSTQYLFTSSC